MALKRWIKSLFLSALLLAAAPAHAVTNYLTSVGVQQGSITIAASSTSNTATISAVGSGAFIVWQGQTSNSTTAQWDDSQCSVTLTNPTTVTANRGVSSTKTCTVNFSVVDGDTTNLIKSVQSGTIAVSTTSATATISAVTNANTATVFTGQTQGSSGSNIDCFAVLSLSGTTVTASRQTSCGNTMTVHYEIVEFQPGALNSSVQNVAYSATAAGTTATVTISSITTANAMAFYGGQSVSNGTNPANYLDYSQINSATQYLIAWNTSDSGVQTRKYNASVVEFAASVLNQSVQRNTIALVSQSTRNASITSSATSSTLLNWLTNNTTATTVNPSTSILNATQANATTVTVAAGASASARGSFEAIQFKPFSAGTTAFGPMPTIH